RSTSYRFVIIFYWDGVAIAYVDSTQTTGDSKSTTISFVADDIVYGVPTGLTADESVSLDSDVASNILPDLDLDGDGYSNFDELDQGSDPEDATDIPTTTTITTAGVTITVNLSDGQTVQDAETVSADASSSASAIKRLVLSKSSGSALSDTNSNADAFDATWDTATDSVTEDSSVTFTFTAQDNSGNTATLAISVTVDNTPNITSFGTSTLIQNGSSASLTWEVGNYSSLLVDNSVGTLSGATGSTSVSPSTTTTYTLTATRTGTSKTFTTTGSVTIQVNYNPSFDGSTTTELGQDPASGVAISWNQSDSTDGLDDTVTGTVTLYEGSDCLSTSSISSTTSTSGSISIAADTLDPRTDYSYTVALSDSNGGSASTSACQNFTTGDTGLVGWWRFDGDVTDSSGNGLDGSDDSPNDTPFVFASGINGSALSLAGNDYVRIPHNSLLDSPQTVELWVLTNTTTGPRGLVDNYNGNAQETDSDYQTGYQLELGRYSNTLNWLVASDGPTLDPIISAEVWTHLVVTSDTDNGSYRLYLNGELADIAEATIEFMANSTMDLYFGANLGGDDSGNFTINSNEALDGMLDEIAIYSRALSTQEIRDFCQTNDPTGSTCADDDVPAQLTPSNGLELPPTRAFLSWEAGITPSGKTFNHYLLCYAAAGEDISSDLSCLNPTTTSDSFSVLEDPITPSNTGYSWKVKACYNAAGTDCSDYSPVWSFSTDDSLVGWWKFQDVNMNDASGKGHNGTLNGDPAFSIGEGIDGALTLDGDDDYVRVSDYADLDGMSALTLEARFMTLDTAQDSKGIVGKYMDIPSSYIFRTKANNTVDFILTTDPDNNSDATNSGQLSAGNWNHMVGTYGDDIQATALNGVFVSSQTLTGDTVNDTTNDLCFGAYCKGLDVAGYFSGYIDEVVIYDKALSEEEIRNSYCAVEALAGSDLSADGCL
ncbi:MAG: LamG domain-containing protein, partial [Deltaproteobacteria bacterium]|nr:LamG domain-containing protein [Deltaproteobacteria bacterium]